MRQFLALFCLTPRQGWRLCQLRTLPPSLARQRNRPSWKPLRARMLRLKHWRAVVGCSYALPRLSTRRISGLPPRCLVIAIRCACGAPGISRRDSRDCRMRHGQDGHGAFPPGERGDVVALATRQPGEGHCPATRWSVEDLVGARRHQPAAPAMSRSTLWRMLDDPDLKPHRSVYGLKRHAPDCDTKARDLCHLDVNAFRFSQDGRLVIGVDAKTGRPMLQRKYPTQGARPGQPWRARTGASIPSRPPGVWRSAVWSLRGVRSPGRPRLWSAAASDAPFSVIPARHLSAIVRPSTARGCTRASYGAVSWHAVSSHGGIFVRAKTLRPSCAPPWRGTIPARPTPIAGRLRDNRWYAPHPSVKPAANNSTGVPGSVLARNVLNVPSLPLDPLNGSRLNW